MSRAANLLSRYSRRKGRFSQGGEAGDAGDARQYLSRRNVGVSEEILVVPCFFSAAYDN